jgi:hypothetical protein
MYIVKFSDYLKDYLKISNTTNKEFAYRVGITPKHLIDILSDKVELTASLIDKISIVMGLPSEYIYRIEANRRLEETIKSYLSKHNLTISNCINKFAYKELFKNGWLEFVNKDDKYEVFKDIIKFLRISSPEKIVDDNSEYLYKSKNEKPELLALWLEKCYRETMKQKVSKYDKNKIKNLIEIICEEALKNEFNEEYLKQTLNEYGIYFVMQEDLPGSKIRGAFKVLRDIPAIYLTYKHQRIADIYFALLHELAHLKSDYNKAKAKALVSYEKESAEAKADEMAYNWMVPNEKYNVIKENGITKENTENIPLSFVVYRLACDKKIKYNSEIYQKYNKVVKKHN